MSALILSPSPATVSYNQQRNHIIKHLRERFAPGEFFEVRMLLRNPTEILVKGELRKVSTISGRFDNPEIAAAVILDFEDPGCDIEAIWCTVNPIDPKCADRVGAREPNAVKVGAYTTHNHQVAERAYWFADFDVCRPEHQNATEEERQVAWTRLQDIIADLWLSHGFVIPLIVDSGNGFHLYWKADRSPANSPIWTRLLHWMSDTYTDSVLKVDTSVGNAARVAGLAGTWNRKDASTHDRPHRVRRVVFRPTPWAVLSYGLIQDIADSHKSDRAPVESDGKIPELKDDAEELLQEFIEEYSDHLDVVGKPVEKSGITYYFLRECPFVERSHSGTKAKTAITISNSSVGFSCFAGSCADKTFADLREKLEDLAHHRSDIHFYQGDEWWNMSDEDQVEYCMDLLRWTWELDPEDCWAMELPAQPLLSHSIFRWDPE